MLPTLLLTLVACPPEEEPPFTVGEPLQEDCLDGRDNDLDGKADCEDADCYEVATCVHEGSILELQVLGADRLEYDRVWKRDGWTSTIALAVYSVTGRLTLLNETGTTSCDWSVDSAYGSMAWSPTNFLAKKVDLDTLDRAGWTIDEECGFGTSEIFPELTVTSYNVVTDDYEVPWYLGTGTQWFSSTKYYEAAAYADVVGWAQSHWSLSSVHAGQVHSFVVGDSSTQTATE